MITFQQFLEKNNGKWVEVAGSSALNQCVDLANAYIRDVLGLPIIEWTNAIDFPSKGGDAYDYILNTPTNIPQEGDLIIWGGNQYGHIAIFIEGNVDSFRSFDQNYPTGSNCHVQNHSYANVKGWMRKKKQEDIGSDIVTRADAFVAVCTLLGVAATKDAAITAIKAKDTRISELEDLNQAKERKNTEIADTLKTLQEKLETEKEENKRLQANYDAAQVTLKTKETTLEELQGQVTELQEKITAETLTPMEHLVKALKGFLGR